MKNILTVLRPKPQEFPTVPMTVEDFHDIPDNPRQRDTERHARIALKKHLAVPHPVHRCVAVAQLPNGDMYKLDGHTRSLLWSDGRLDAPDELTVDVWFCRDLDEAKQYYSTYDNNAAMETSVNKAFGALRECGYAASSSLVKQTRYTGGMRMAYLLLEGGSTGRAYDPYTATPEWLAEIKLLDCLHFSKHVFTAGPMGAFFLCYRLYGDPILPFFIGVNNKLGNSVNGRHDMVGAYVNYIERAHAAGAIGGSVNTLEHLNAGVNAAQGFLKSRRCKRLTLLKSADFKKFLVDVRAASV